MIINAYWAFEGYESELAHELKLNSITAEQDGRLFITRSPIQRMVWAQLHLPNAEIIEFQSISEAAKKAKQLGKRWAGIQQRYHRRAELIQKQLFNYKDRPLEFLGKVPDFDWGFWTLLAEDKLLAAPKTGSAFPGGEISFLEDKINAPSRAYLKLWEVFTVHGFRPKISDVVLDLGSSPGGWTWVLQGLGCQVLSVDKAELDPRLLKLPHLKILKKDAFKLRPSDVGPIDWLFSDLICYPQKLLELVELWMTEGQVRNFVCTIKFKGPTDYQTMNKFLKIPNSRIIHLNHNKHEVTWLLKNVIESHSEDITD